MSMRISEVIFHLQKFLEVHGDLPVEKECHETYGTIRNQVTSVELEQPASDMFSKVIVL